MRGIINRLSEGIESGESKSEILAIIKRGETEDVEFKCALRWNFKTNQASKEVEFMIMKTISAFLNSKGGTLLIGVRDDGKLEGVDKDLESLAKNSLDGFNLYLYDLIERYIGKEFCQYVHLYFEDVENKKIAEIKIEPSECAAYIRHNNLKEFYIRAGSSSRLLDVEEANNYIKLHFK